MSFESLFYCDRREMPVAKDTSDCLGCGLREYPSPCKQFAHYHLAMKRGELGYRPTIFADGTPAMEIRE